MMTPSHGPARGCAERATRPFAKAGNCAASGMIRAGRSCTYAWLAGLFSLLWGASRAFAPVPCTPRPSRHSSSPTASSSASLWRIERQQLLPTAPEPPGRSVVVCRMADQDIPPGDESGAADQEQPGPDPSAEDVTAGVGSGSSSSEGEHMPGMTSEGGEEAGAEGGGLDKDLLFDEKRLEELDRKIKEVYALSDQEILARYPDVPPAPYELPPDPRDMTLEQLLELQEESKYGAKPLWGAKKAIREYEANERARVYADISRRSHLFEVIQEKTAIEAKLKAEVTEEEADEEELRYRRRLKKRGLARDLWRGKQFAEYHWEERPELITFSSFGTLYNWHVPVGCIFRDALSRALEHNFRLPGPQHFELSFEKSLEDAHKHMPCYGAHHNMSSWDWWYHVFTDTYLRTVQSFEIPDTMIHPVLDEVTDELFYEIFVGPEAFELVPWVKVVLDGLAEWRDMRYGPKLAVVCNDDERLRVTLENLGILPYFDFVLTSHEVGIPQSEAELYEKAQELAGVRDPSKALHVGSDYHRDVVGPRSAGWSACVVKPRQDPFENPEEEYQYHRLIRIGELLHRLGQPGADMPTLTRRRGNFWEEPDESLLY